VPALNTLAIPVGGGGLIAGCATVAASLHSSAVVYGVESETYTAMHQRLAGLDVNVGSPTVAEGMAVRDVGERPLAIFRERVKSVLVVSENAIAMLAENAKIVAEGAGAAGLAAVLAYPNFFKGRAVGIPICGANIDSRVLANVLQRVMLRDGRMIHFVLDIPDRPGVLGEIRAASERRAAISSRFRTTGFSHRRASKRLGLKSWSRPAMERTAK
jgi:threonine dehydratase